MRRRIYLINKLQDSEYVIITITLDNLFTLTDVISLNNIRILENNDKLQIMTGNTEIVLSIEDLTYNELEDIYEYERDNSYLSLQIFRK